MISFTLNGKLHKAQEILPSTTLLDYLRNELKLTGTKEGCAEGDCGACTVVRVNYKGDTHPFQAINSCLVQIGQVDGLEILTIEGLVPINMGSLTPVQEKMASANGTQCGFCTPGFICALFALGQSEEKICDNVIHDALAGNLCRCTGYRPIIEAAREGCQKPIEYRPLQPPKAKTKHRVGGQNFYAPKTLKNLTLLRSRYPEAMLLAGGTDLGLSISKERQQPENIIHIAQVKELREITETNSDITIGSAVTFSEFLPSIKRLYPSFGKIIHRFGSRQIRNLCTLGGNIGNASPIADAPPCLMALGATLVLADTFNNREIDFANFFIDYKKTDLKPSEVIKSISIPKLKSNQVFRAYKVSKRFDQDISSVIGAFFIEISNEQITKARVVFGGMASKTRHATTAEKCLTDKIWSEETAIKASKLITRDFVPISDQRASAKYRTNVASNLFVRFWRELNKQEQDLEVVSLS